jgi:hypothetical protein
MELVEDSDRRKIQTNKGEPSRHRVARAVIVQACRDIVLNNRKFIDFYDEGWGTIRASEHALWFFTDEGVDAGSYAWYCSLIDLDPEPIRVAIRVGNWDMLSKIADVAFH